MAGNPISETELKQLRKHHADGLSLNASAKKLGRPVTTVRRAALRLGLTWDRTKTAAAVQAAAVDAAVRRTAQQQRYLDLVDELQERLADEYEHAIPAGADGEIRRWRTRRPPARETADLMRAATAASTAELRLADYKARDSHDDARDIVLQFGLAVRAAELPDDDA